MLPEFTREELAAGLDAVAAEVLDRSGVAGPPVDAFLVARRLGMAVATDAGQEGRGRFVRLGKKGRPSGQAAILIRPEERSERSQWTVAHEIGEAMAHRAFAAWGADPAEVSPRAREEVANWLAGRLLLPTRWFVHDGIESGWNLLVLKARYTTASHELVARRMLECPPAVIVTIFDHGRVHFRRANVHGRVPPLSPAETECWRAVHGLNHPEQAYDGLRKIQGWPIHEPEWKREILRSEVDIEGVDV